jgi:hypothetical protein
LACGEANDIICGVTGKKRNILIAIVGLSFIGRHLRTSNEIDSDAAITATARTKVIQRKKD